MVSRELVCDPGTLLFSRCFVNSFSILAQLGNIRINLLPFNVMLRLLA
jgi:hypothetical protein